MSGLAQYSAQEDLSLPEAPVDAMTEQQCNDWMALHGGRLVWDNHYRSAYVEIGEGRTRRVGPWRTGRWNAIAAAMVCIGSEEALLDYHAGRAPATSD